MWILLIIILFIAGIIFSIFRFAIVKDDSDTNNEIQNVKSGLSKQELIDSIQTKDQYLKLKRKCDSIENRYQNFNFDDDSKEKAFKKLEYERDLYNDVLNIASDKIFEWQFSPDCDFNTPLEVLEIAFSVYCNVTEVNNIKRKFPDFENSFDILRPGEDIAQKRIKLIDELIEYKKLMNSNIAISIKVEKLDLLEKEHPKLKKVFRYPNNLTLGKYVAYQNLVSSGVPKPLIFIEKGVYDLKAIIDFDLNEFSKWNGIGEISKKELHDFQKRNA